MPITRSPLRLDADLLASASLAAPAMSRSVAQQVAHWALIGRELEGSPDVSLKAIGDVLAGRAGYDGLPPRERAVVRAFWVERMKALRDGLRLDREFAASGYAFAELDERGRVVVRRPKRAPRRAGRNR